jgi:hypothetical protein
MSEKNSEEEVIIENPPQDLLCGNVMNCELQALQLKKLGRRAKDELAHQKKLIELKHEFLPNPLGKTVQQPSSGTGTQPQTCDNNTRRSLSSTP